MKKSIDYTIKPGKMSLELHLKRMQNLMQIMKQ